MNNPVISEIYKTTDYMDDLPYNDITSLIKHLSDSDGFTRIQARDVLSPIGTPVVPKLIKVLSNANTQLRWEVTKVLDSTKIRQRYLSS
jgi:hypothetical protein